MMYPKKWYNKNGGWGYSSNTRGRLPKSQGTCHVPMELQLPPDNPPKTNPGAWLRPSKSRFSPVPCAPPRNMPTKRWTETWKPSGPQGTTRMSSGCGSTFWDSTQCIMWYWSLGMWFLRTLCLGCLGCWGAGNRCWIVLRTLEFPGCVESNFVVGEWPWFEPEPDLRLFTIQYYSSIHRLEGPCDLNDDSLAD